MSTTQSVSTRGNTASAVPTIVRATGTPINVATEMVTVERAKLMLLKRRNPRPLSKNTVLNYTETMRRGEWSFNGDPIRFNEDGELIDGQHRLQAIISSGKPQKMLVIHGLDNESFDTIDVGKRRSPSDLLAIAGYKNTTSSAAIARALIVYESGVYWASEAARNLDSNPTGKQILAYVEEHSEVDDASSLINSKYPFVKRISGPSAIGLAYILAWRQNRAKALSFIAGLAGEEPCERNDPRWVAREYLTRQKIESKLRRVTTGQAQAVLVKAANLYFAGLPASSTILRYQPDKHWFPRFDGGKKDTKDALRREKEKK